MSLSRLLGALWTPSISIGGPPNLPSRGFQDSFGKGFHFLVQLAWETRYIFPIMYAVFSFLFDFQMRLEIIIHRERRVVVVEEHVAEENQEDSGSEESDNESGSQQEDEDESGNEDLNDENLLNDVFDYENAIIVDEDD